ncbi:MAG: DUF885 domain-containing protein [Woeseiaceae bacterium]
MSRTATLFASLLFVLTACGQSGEAPVTPQATARTAQTESPDDAFDRALDDLTRAFFYHNPELATTYGVSEVLVPRTAHRLMSRSLEGEAARRDEVGGTLARVKAIDPDSLSGNRPRVHATLTTLMEGALGPVQVVDFGTVIDGFGFWYLPYTINQLSGPTVSIPNFLNNQQPVTNAEDAEAYLVRLAAVKGALDGALENVRDAVSKGAIPPDFVVDKSLAVVESFIAAPASENALYVSFIERLDAAGVDGAGNYAAQALNIVDEQVIPAYRAIADYLGEIRGSAPHDAGIWRVPNGEALYEAMIRHMTDSDRSPDEVHQTGLDEVARITAEMDEILRAEGYTGGTVGERMQQLGAEERFLYPNNAEGREALLADARAQVAGIKEVMPDWFLNQPNHPVEVRPVPDFSQDSAPTGYYNPPARDGSRPGIYWLNVRDTALHPKFALPTLSYHEAIPGHHTHFATTIEQDIPPIVQAIWSNSAGEGWALYAERLAAEMGMYEGDSFGDLGRLQAELHRAVRLVVDTGMHAKKWSREQAIEYMIDAEGVEESTAVSEVERYAVWPGQALGYKLGMLKILELRAEAQERLGDSFDIREFNDTVLHVASTPLPYIEATVREWIEKTDK